MDIDFVITWVDGNDPAWLEDKRRHAPRDGQGDGENRYRDWDTLRYLFRGIETYTPWVRHVHLVTWGHLPPWLNTSCPKLKVVRHTDIIPQKYLPTFSSHPIEWHMHRIPGLSEHFVYFNDDTLMTHPMKQEDFFKNGLPRDVAIANAVAPRDMFSYIVMNNLVVINRHFQKREVLKKHLSKWINLGYGAQLFRTFALWPWRDFTGFIDTHLPLAFLKQTFNDLWETEHEVLSETCTHKFRHAADVSVWLARYWQLAKGEFVPARYGDGQRHWLNSAAAVKPAVKDITAQKYAMICINDELPSSDFPEAKAQIAAAFSAILPKVSAFETAKHTVK